MSIGFDLIPLSVNTPGTFAEFDPTRAVRGVQALPHDVLLTGQKLSGAATAGQMYEVETDAEAVSLFGANSMLRQMIREYKRIDPQTRTFACSSAADGGTAASGTVTLGGTATEAGELPLYIAGRRVAIPVAVGDTAVTVETNGLTAFALVANDLPVTVDGASIVGFNYTAKQAGTCGNQIMIGACLQAGERVPAGLTCTIVAMASGATDPSYSGVITAMGEDQYHTIASGNAGDTVLDLFEAELESRWGPMRQIEGHVFAALYDTRADLTTAGNARNSFASCLVGAEKSALLPLPWELAAQAAARSALQAQVDPSRAMTGLSFSGFSAAHRGSRFTRAERDILLSDGVSTVLAGSDGRLLIERFVTTYQTNPQSLPDTAYQDLTTVRLLAAIRYSLRARIASRFARFKLVSDGTPIPAGQPIVNPGIIRGEIIALFQDWMDLGWVEGLAQFKSELVVERNASDPNRVDMLLPPDLINNLLVTAAKISFKR